MSLAQGGTVVRAPVPKSNGSKRVRHGASRLKPRKPGFRFMAKARGLVVPVGCVLVMAAGVMAAQSLAPAIGDWMDGPIRTVRVAGDVQFQNPEQVRAVLESMPLDSFFDLDLAGIKQSVEALPWVRAVNLRRTWPSTLELTVHEHAPIAIWGDGALLSEQGMTFAPDNAGRVTGLPTFDGPKGFEIQMMQAYSGFSSRLREAGLRISVLRLSQRGSWEIELDSGQLLRLGRTETLQRVERFTALHDQYLGERLATVAVVDARYSHGIAVTWKPGTERVEEEQG